MKNQLAIVVLMLLTMGRFSEACDLPVFRYALEQWHAYPYRLLVFTDGGDSSREELRGKLAELLPPDNYDIEFIFPDASDAMPEFAENQEVLSVPPRLPYGILMLPLAMHSQNRPEIWRGVLDEQGIRELRRLIYSPLLRDVCHSLASGETAVWILFKGPDEEDNQRTSELLRNSLDQLSKNLLLPHQLDPLDSEYKRLAPGIPLKLSFKILEAKMDAPENKLLRSALEAFDDHFATYRESALVIPIYGRVRALAVLHGEDIDEEVFAQISWFLTGPCSCQIKRLNPGYDLLAPFPWDDVLHTGVSPSQILAEAPWAPIPAEIQFKEDDIGGESAKSAPAPFPVAAALAFLVVIVIVILVLRKIRNG